MDIRGDLEIACGEPVVAIDALSGGCIGQVYRVEDANGRVLVAKVDDSATPRLDIEGFMLTYLAERTQLPVPEVLHSKPHLLLMSWLPGRSSFDAAAQERAAELLAALHAHSAPRFGFERDTLIGGLRQPNTPVDSWLDFFREQRLRYMAAEAARVGRLPDGFLARIDRLAVRLDEWLLEPQRPSLIHGDVWTTNVLAYGSTITGFLDPAIYYADPEIELAFITLFSTFGTPFFARYQELRPLAPGFFEIRRDLYNLYPLLVHCRLFGGSYVGQVDTILRRMGF
jgi:fructosamine-3-kinase